MASGEIDIAPGRVLGPTEPITAEKLNDLGRPTLRLKELSITKREIAEGTISTSKLDSSVEGQLGLDDGSVTTAKIANLAVTTPKIAEGQTFDHPLILSQNAVFTYRPRVVVASNTVPGGYSQSPTFERMALLYIQAGLLARDGEAVRAHFALRATGACSGTKTVATHLVGSAGSVTIDSYPSTFSWADIHMVIWVARVGAMQQVAMGYQQGHTNLGSNARGFASTFASHLCAQTMIIELFVAGPCNDFYMDYSMLEFLPPP